MLIDWFTVAAQVVNFLILLGLLRFFLYARIIGAMDRRADQIESRFQEAERKREEAEKEASEYERKSRELQRDRDSVLEEARVQAKKRRSELLAEAREEVDGSREDWIGSLRREKESFLRELRERAAGEAVALARQTLEEMADTGLEERMARAMEVRLDDLDEEEKEEIAGAIRKSGGNVIVRSAFELPEKARGRIAEALHKLRVGRGEEDDEKLNLDYKTEPELVCGVELEAGGKKLGWSIDDHLNRLEEEMEQMFERQSHRRDENPHKDDLHKEGSAERKTPEGNTTNNSE